MGQVSCVSSIRPLRPLRGTDVGGTLTLRVFRRKAVATRSGNSHEMRQVAQEMRQVWRPNRPTRSGVAPREAESGLDLGDLGAADRHPRRRRAIEFDDRAVAFLADESGMR